MKKWNIWTKWNQWTVAVALMMVFSLTACDDNDGFSIGDVATDWVTVQKDASDVCRFQADNWGRLWPAVPDVRFRDLVNGQRLIMAFNPLYEDYPEGYDFSVKVLQFRPVLTKPIELLMPGQEGEFGNDVLVIPNDGMWIGGDYLNVVFAQSLPKEKKHRISLVRKAGTKLEADGFLTLELRYNTFGDTTDRWAESTVSYHLNLLPLLTEDEVSALKGIRVKVNAKDHQQNEWVFEFKQK